MIEFSSAAIAFAGFGKAIVCGCGVGPYVCVQLRCGVMCCMHFMPPEAEAVINAIPCVLEHLVASGGLG